MKYSDIEQGLEWASSDYGNAAYLDLKNGKIYYAGDYADEKIKIPKDLEHNPRYLKIPSRRDLDLGRNLVFEFMAEHMPDDYLLVQGYFRRSGAYSNFKNLLAHKDRLQDWYTYEAEAVRQALLEWCEKHQIALEYNSPMTSHKIETIAQLEALYDEVGEPSKKKEVPFIHPVYRQWIEAAPFAVLATVGPNGLDASPRGDPPGLVTVLDDKTLLLPERRGNNRIDSLRNILTDPRVALLFFIPSVGETLRVNGRASISTAPELLARFEVEGKPPRCVLVIEVETVFFQCARAIQRSRLWQPSPPELLERVPSAGTILEALTEAAIDGGQYDRELPARQGSTLY